MADAIPEQWHDLLALTLVPGMGPKLTAALLAHFGSAAAVRQAAAEQLSTVPHIGDKLSRQFAEALRRVDLQRELDLLAKHGVSVVPLSDPNYPALLARIDNPPPLLYYRGSLSNADSKAIGIVGTRNCSAYGRRMTDRLASALARAGFTIVSGLALGIDGEAHQAALKAGGRTIAVLAGGLSHIYPPPHLELAAQIEQVGCLFTETPMSMSPEPGMFPARNRIISGLSVGVVIVEAPEGSGALHTAEHAVAQGREVFVVPGPADSNTSAGCLRLIREGARLIRHADDILEDLSGISPLLSPAKLQVTNSESLARETPKIAPVPTGLDEPQQRVWNALEKGPQHIDDLVQGLAIPVSQLAGILMMLEMKKVVRRLPGNQFERRT
ncbi:MAG TPA: DNA-processing protein DprA [Gemmataceae bacterium]|jgi:DNA processing protein|nr:DNA-processing protein DprA [Gemmataceae bacterium]